VKRGRRRINGQRRIKLIVFTIFLFLVGFRGNYIFAQTETVFVQYYVLINSTVTGPYQLSDLRRAIIEKQYSQNMLTTKTGLDSWAPAADYPEIRAIFENPAPVVPPAAMAEAPATATPQSAASQSVPVAAGNTPVIDQDADGGFDESDYIPGAKFALSLGVGARFNLDTTTVEPSGTADFSSTAAGGGLNVFVDAVYAAFNFSYSFGSLVYQNGDIDKSADFPKATSTIRLGLYGKYPFYLSDTFIFFPIIGVDYEIYLSAKNGAAEIKLPTEDLSAGSSKTEGATIALSAPWLKAGIGCDMFFTQFMFLRLEALYGLRFNNKTEAYKQKSDSFDVDTVIAHGLDCKISLGVRF
jgi:hypothetical protein